MDRVTLSKQLIDALAESPANPLIIRKLCCDSPGLIASAGLRLKAWSVLLLGTDSAADFRQIKLIEPADPCGEQHVLEADVHRTRAEIETLRTPEMRQMIKNILQKFCIDHEIQYKQGMNEVLAPFLVVNPELENQGVSYALFKAFLFRYLERFFCLDESSYLFKAFRLFHLLLVYFDPQLANYLHDFDFSPELYSPQWFLTLFARSLPLAHVLRLWDVIIAVDDPAFTFFIGLCMLRSKRSAILLADGSNIPEIISNISFRSDDDIDSTVIEAMKLYRSTPRCILRHLRLCCISTTELAPAPKLGLLTTVGRSFTTQLQQMRLNVEEHDQRMALQAARNCFLVTAQELIESMLSPHGGAEDAGGIGGTTAFPPQQFVIIDIRSYEESVLTGGGTLPRAMQLEPAFLNQPEAFDIWIQHFDGTRGCNICIIDLPPVKWTGVALWRRLLLGEGDGAYSSLLNGRLDFDDTKENHRRLEALLSGKRFTQGKSIAQLFYPQLEDEKSKYFKEEHEAREQDLDRPAMLLAIALQTHAFPNVSVLDGGFPALVEQLQESRGTVEPIIINHEEEKWKGFLKSTGRTPTTPKIKKPHITVSDPGDAAGVTGSSTSSSTAGSFSPKKPPEQVELQRYETALKVADQLQHPHMMEQLRTRVKSLRDKL